MATWTVMVTVTEDQWLELHKRTLDCIRAVLAGCSRDDLLWQPVATGEAPREVACLDPRPFCIGAIVSHLCAVEAERLVEVKVPADFAAPRECDWNTETFANILDRIEHQYHGVLKKGYKDRRVLFGLGRVCQHNLYHLAQLVHLRCRRDPDWRPPLAGQAGSWMRAVDYMTDLLILGDKAAQTPSQT